LDALSFGCKSTHSTVKSGAASPPDVAVAAEKDPILDSDVPEDDEEFRLLASCQGTSVKLAGGSNIYLFFLQLDGRFEMVVSENLGIGTRRNKFTLLESAAWTKPVPRGRDQLKSMNFTLVSNKDETVAIEVSNGRHVLVYSAPTPNSKFAELLLEKTEKAGKISFTQSDSEMPAFLSPSSNMILTCFRS
jgi:hypothetical protein